MSDILKVLVPVLALCVAYLAYRINKRKAEFDRQKAEAEERRAEAEELNKLPKIQVEAQFSEPPSPIKYFRVSNAGEKAFFLDSIAIAYRPTSSGDDSIGPGAWEFLTLNPPEGIPPIIQILNSGEDPKFFGVPPGYTGLIHRPHFNFLDEPPLPGRLEPGETVKLAVNVRDLARQLKGDHARLNGYFWPKLLIRNGPGDVYYYEPLPSDFLDGYLDPTDLSNDYFN